MDQPGVDQATASFPALRDAAQVAEDRRDWPEALRRWDIVHRGFADRPEGARGVAAALLELAQADKAQAVLTPALLRFPASREIAVLAGWVATRMGDTAAAEQRWAAVRAQFPDEPAGYAGWVLALKSVARLDEAEAVLLQARARFPDDPFIAIDLCGIARERQDWPAALARGREAVARFPNIPWAHRVLGEAAILSGRVAEGEAVFTAALVRFPDRMELAAGFAEMATSLADWDAAERRWGEVAARFPQEPAGPIGLGIALREAGRIEASVACLREAAERFAGHFDVAFQLACSLSAQRAWPEALSLWASLKERYPGNRDVQSRVADLLWKARQDQAELAFSDNPDAVRFEIPEKLLRAAGAAEDPADPVGSLLMEFESLGDNCEFGLVQRRFGAEPLGLLRWAVTPADDLLRALRARFAGVGDAGQTVMEVLHGEYITRDRQYYMYSHTFTAAASEPIERFAPRQCRRLRYLRDRLVEELEAAEVIFVLSAHHRHDAQIAEIYGALLAYSAANALLVVVVGDEMNPPGTLERLGRYLFVGTIDRLVTQDINYDVWVDLCRRTAAIVRQERGR